MSSGSKALPPTQQTDAMHGCVWVCVGVAVEVAVGVAVGHHPLWCLA